MTRSSQTRARRTCIGAFAALVLSVFTVFTPAAAQTWTPVAIPDPGVAGTMALLTPNAAGSYINGTWSESPAPMSTARLYFASHILPDGRYWVLGGEYTGEPVSCHVHEHGRNL